MTLFLTGVAIGVLLGWFLTPLIDDKIFPDDEIHHPKQVKPSDIWGW